MAAPLHVNITGQQRLFPQLPGAESTVALSLLDATSANFALTNACKIRHQGSPDRAREAEQTTATGWLFEKPRELDVLALAPHLCRTLTVALNAYPQWCGRLSAVGTIDRSELPNEAQRLPMHAQRYGRVYVQFGGAHDIGVHFVTASSSASLDELHAPARPTTQPLWNRQRQDLKAFVPPTDIAHALKPSTIGTDGALPPLMAVQLTTLSCGGFILAVKIAHPLADISALSNFVRHWAQISRSTLDKNATTSDFRPIFDPQLLDMCAAGDIDAAESDAETISQAQRLPLHRYDWWQPPAQPPVAFDGQKVQPAGRAMPWTEWDSQAPVSTHTIHLSRDRVETLYAKATTPTTPEGPKISRHDAILAHIWSCVVRARQLHRDLGLVHCDLTLGLRPALQLPSTYVGSPTMMVNVELSGTEVAAPDAQNRIAQSVRQVITTVTRRQNLAAHLHSVAYEQSPQRIWQAFLGQRHILVTTWARAGIYNVDFGLGSRLRYVEGVMPVLDGLITIKEGPPSSLSPGDSEAWTCNGVDITLSLSSEAMESLLQDPLLLP